MENTPRSEQKQAEESKQQEKSNQGFYKRRRGIYEHIEDGTIDLLENGIHDYLCLKANLVIGGDSSKPAGVCITSAQDLRAHCKRWVHSDRTMQRILDHMERIGWIRTWPRHHGNYPVLICRATVHDLSGNEYRVNAEATEGWEHPVYGLVGQLSANASKVGDCKRVESREKRERVSRDRRQLSLSGKVWEELKIKTLPSGYKGFVEIVESTPRGEESLVAWFRRIMDLCDERGDAYRYAPIFFKRFKQAEAEEAQKRKGTDTRSGEAYSVSEDVYVQA